MALIFTGCAAPPAQSGVHRFELKDGTMEERGTQFPFAMNGILGVPESEKAPVVFILHGSHEVNDAKSDDYYDGFSYLAERLTKAGFFTVGINLNIVFIPEPIEGDPYNRLQTIFDSYYDALEKANKGENIFGMDLTNKMDLSKINFIGHSRGGFYSMYLSKQLSEKGINVVSNLLVAPSIAHLMEEAYYDVPTGIIVPQYDGDVATLDGYQIYQHAAADPSRSSQISAAFLYGGNHNWFNTKLEAETLTTYENATYITPEEEQAFLCDYAEDFLRLYNFQVGSQSQTLGEDFQKRHKTAIATSMFDPSNKALVSGNTPAITSGGLKAENLISSLNRELNTVGAFTTPLLWEQSLPLNSLTWNSQGSVSYATDKVKAKSIIVSLALDSSRSKQAAIEVVITDISGNQVAKTLTSKSSPTLHYYDGKLIEEAAPFWSALTPIASVEIDVSTLSELESIEIKTASESGAIMLQSINARLQAE